MSIASLEDSSETFTDIEAFGVFDGIEIGGAFSCPGIFGADSEEDCKINVLNTVSLFPSALTRSIADQNDPIVKDFIHSFGETIRLVESDTFSMDVGWDRVIGEPEGAARRISLLKKLVPLLYRYRKKLCFPLRVPGTTVAESAFILDRIRELMFAGFACRLDVHPHENGAVPPPEDSFSKILFNLPVLRILYEPETGNRLVPELIVPYIEILKKTAFKGTLVFCPAASKAARLEAEARAIARMFQEKLGLALITAL